MNSIRCHARRLAGLLAGLAGILLALGAGAPAAFALPLRLPHPGGGPGAGATSGESVPAGAHTTVQPPGVVSRLEGPVQPAAQQSHAVVSAHIHTVTVGMPGWQITLIAIGAALAAAALAVLVDRAVTSRRRISPTAA
jgi:hypothetical protein